MSYKNLLSHVGMALCLILFTTMVILDYHRNRIPKGQSIEGVIIEHGSNSKLPNLWLHSALTVATDRYEIIDESGMLNGSPIIRPIDSSYTKIRNSKGDWFVAGHVGTIGERHIEYSAWPWPP